METQKKLLSTSSPEGIQIASQITPTRLANLLIRKGPLPIRHITTQLTLEVAGFDQLSLSKQRRLIMSAMEQGDTENNVVFEKIGWGQWAVRKMDSDYIVTQGTETSATDDVTATKNGVADSNNRKINVKELRQQNLKLGWSKKQDRRESISNKDNLHNLEVPEEKVNHDAVLSSDDDIDADDSDDDEDIANRDEDSDDIAIDSDSESEEDLFKFDDQLVKFANRVPLKLSPPPNSFTNVNNRRKSTSNISKPYRSQMFNRSRLDSLDNLDNYILSKSINSPLARSPDYNITSGSFPSSLNGGRRKSSFNESNIRSTLSSTNSPIPRPSSHVISTNSIPSIDNVSNAYSPNVNNYSNHLIHLVPSNKIRSIDDTIDTTPIDKPGDNGEDTDEEDWQSIGAESLRKKEEDETKAAANALMLMNV